MKATSVIFLMFFAGVVFAEVVVNSRSIDRGYGFREIRTVEAKNISTTKTSKHRYIYYKDQKLGQIKQYSISPSGSYIVFVSDPEGSLFLYTPSEKLITLLAEKIKSIRKFSWNETYEVLTIELSDKSPAMNFAIE